MININEADVNDAEEILDLQKEAYISEAEIYNDYTISPLHQTLEEIKHDFSYKKFVKLIINRKIIGSIRGFNKNDTCYIERIIVQPNYQNQGLGKKLLRKLEKIFDKSKRYELYSGYKSEKNLYFYKKNGYRPFKEEILNENVKLIFLEKYKQKNNINIQFDFSKSWISNNL